MATQYDVIVIGGGLSGAQCAADLKSKGVNVLLIEARDRFGGRTESIKVEDYWFDLGGQWMGGTHNILKKVCNELRIESFPQYDEGNHILELNNKHTLYKGNISTLNTDYNLEGLESTIAIIDKMAEELDASKPYDHPRAKEWDNITLANWIRDNVKGSDAVKILNWFCKVCLAGEPTEISFLWYLLFIKAAGGYGVLADIRGGAQQDRLIGGSQQISERLVRERVGNFLLNCKVVGIHQDNAGVTVLIEGGQRFRAKFVANTIPPALAGRIDYKPALPASRDSLTQRMPMGSVIKTIVIYDEPFWRRDGFSAEALSEHGPIFICYDDSSHDDKANAIVGFIAGQDAREWSEKTPEVRKQAVLECYARWFGPRALKPKYYLEKDWKTDEFARGAYLAFAQPGTLTACGKSLREPVGRMHFAGTETATQWIGYMEGALESGLRCSKELQSRLQQDQQSYNSKL
ncbi:amine oxidase [Cavenderia fasciculata]|uniref:Amine oxidase n=1 Tax=Cavenderia fasciculata TaxID=261658 RepID=F4PMY1_CACFS|nr:amine oxidase [Cavenderia fasciculata]EGG22874.1 amine oxidase [Cavenderia fasciculata]|eukprot:XP_004360725.1 amine oxidase [Cavenderia fasciculata]